MDLHLRDQHILITGGSGFVEAYNFDNQPGCVAALGLPLWNRSIPYWFAADGQHLAVSVRIDGAGFAAWAGKLFRREARTRFMASHIATKSSRETEWIGGGSHSSAFSSAMPWPAAW